MYPDVDRLVSTLDDMFESVKPSNKGLPELNQRHTLDVPLRYRCIHLMTTQCSLPGFLMKRSTTPITYAMSGLLDTIAYIRLLIVEAHGTFIILAFSAFVFGLSLPDN